MPTSRRELLSSVAAGLLLADLFPGAVQAAPVPRRKFLFAYFEGGWDLLLGLDPRDARTTNPATQLIDPGYGLLGALGARGVQQAGALRFGPAVPRAFLDVAGECSVVQGVAMDTASHEAGRRYFLTGRFPRGITAVGSSTAAEVAAQQGELSTIPHLSLDVEAYATGLPPHAAPLSAGSVVDLLIALRPLSSVDPSIAAAVKAYQDARGCAGEQLDAQGLVTQVERSQGRARAFLAAQLDRLFDVYSATDAAMAQLRARHDLAAAGADPSAPEVLGLLAAQALKHDVSQCVSVRVARVLDTHGQDWASDQGPRQERGWKVLAAILADLKATPSRGAPGKTVLDETTVLAFSEFGRTPLFNSIRGRDHFLGNSVLVAGAGVKKGLTIGESAAVGMMPQETSLSTGRVVLEPTAAQRDSGDVVILSPKNVLATLLTSAGLDASYLRADPIRALLA